MKKTFFADLFLSAARAGGFLLSLFIATAPVYVFALTPPSISALTDSWQLSIPDATSDNWMHYVAFSGNGSSVSGATGNSTIPFPGAPLTHGLEVIESVDQLDGGCPSLSVYTGDPLTDFACAISYANANGKTYSIATAARTVAGAPTITLAQNGSTLSVRASYGEAANTSLTPNITFNQDISPVATSTGGAWSSGDSVYTASFTLQNNQQITNLTAGATGTRSQNDGLYYPAASSSPFSIDTRIPSVTLYGPTALTVGHGATFVDPGATSTSITGSSLPVIVSGDTLDTSTNGTYSLIYTATDAHGNIATTSRTVTVQDAAGQTALQATTTLQTNTSRAIVTPNNTATSTVSVASNITTPSLDISSVMSGASATIPGTTDIQASTTVGDIYTSIPAGTIITTTDSSLWSGILNLPQATTTYSNPVAASGFTASVTSAIEMGLGDTPLTLSAPIMIRFAGQAGKTVGWSQGGAFHLIDTVCDSATNPTTFGANNDCAITSGDDLLVWTKHLTTFITYTQNAVPVVHSGGGGGGGGGSAPITLPVVTPTATSTTSLTTATPVPTLFTNNTDGAVLGASAYNFSQRFGMGAHGEDVTALQQFLKDAVGYTGPISGYFGSGTQAAVMKYQKQQGITPVTGFVGIKTLARLNQGSVPGTTSVATPTTTPSLAASSTPILAPAGTFTENFGRGFHGKAVVALQKILIAESFYVGDVTGYFGSLTEAAVKHFQTANHIEATGIVGTMTRARLEGR